ncbi:MAG: hypothetical protein LBT59_25550 [Clostridiales bacterium]|jgi:hypothetical protein|nr:hypothetical protein [Clostridiales bacterium]
MDGKQMGIRKAGLAMLRAVTGMSFKILALMKKRQKKAQGGLAPSPSLDYIGNLISHEACEKGGSFR